MFDPGAISPWLEAADHLDPAVLALCAALAMILATAGVQHLTAPGLVMRRLGGASTGAVQVRDRAHLWSQIAARALPLAAMVHALLPARVLEDYRRRLALAGPRAVELPHFLALKALSAIGGCAIGAVVASLIGGRNALWALAIGGAIGLIAPGLALERAIRRRRREVERAIPDGLDLLTVSVEAGLGFDAALARVAEKRPDALGQEFATVLSEIRLGRSRRDALTGLVERTDAPDLQAFVTAIVQSDQLGTSVGRVLSAQSAQIRIRRRQRAQELAQKAPIKMLFPLVFLIFPSLFVVILGPALPGIFRSLGPAS